jgi:hypothetical protein
VLGLGRPGTKVWTSIVALFSDIPGRVHQDVCLCFFYAKLPIFPPCDDMTPPTRFAWSAHPHRCPQCILQPIFQRAPRLHLQKDSAVKAKMNSASVSWLRSEQGGRQGQCLGASLSAVRLPPPTHTHNSHAKNFSFPSA